MTTLCDDCNASGLPILPVRYVPVPNTVNLALPAWAGGHRVIDVPLGNEYHYALRTLRSGYLYLFYSKNQRGSNIWECYMVTEDGLLLRQPDPLMAAAPLPTAACKRQGHSDARLHHIVIQRPDKCGPTWIAFSERKWSEETIREYTANSSLRDARMQTIRPAAMATGAKHSHGVVATAAALEEVIEYATNFSTSTLPCNAPVKALTKEDGSFDTVRPALVSTRYPWHQRQGQAAESVRQMQQRAKKPDGSSGTPHILALWDAIGTVHELCGFRNDAAGWLKQYSDERELQMSASNALAQVKKTLETGAVDRQRSFQDQMRDNAGNWYDPELAKRQRAEAAKLPEPERSQRIQICDISEDWGKKKVPMISYVQRLNHIQEMRFTEPRRSKEIGDLQREVSRFLAARDKNYNKNLVEAQAQAWPKYEKKLDSPALDLFRKNWSRLLQEADAIIDRRTEVLIGWLDADLFLDALEDFHQTNLADGVAFEDTIGTAILGIGSTKVGADKIVAWVGDMKATLRKNLIWRAIAINQKEGIEAVDAAIKHAKETIGIPLTLESAQAMASGSVKYISKIESMSKSALTLHNQLRKDGVMAVPTGGLEKILITIGERVLQPFLKRGVDAVGERIIQGLLLARAGASHASIMGLVLAEARHAKEGRTEALLFLSLGKALADKKVTKDFSDLRAAWQKLLSAADTPKTNANPKLAGGFNEARDVRFALVALMMQGVFVWKLSQDADAQPGNEKVKAELLAAKLSLGSAAVDIGATAIKGLAAAKDAAVSYQLLKAGGGVISAAAAWIAVDLDIKNTEHAVGKQRYGLAVAYGMRTSANAIGGGLQLLASLSYLAPAAEAIALRFPASVVARSIGLIVGRLFAWRAIMMLGGLGLSVASLAITFAIWYFSDDELQDWCERCAFGKERTGSKGFRSAKVQQVAYDEALLDVI